MDKRQTRQVNTLRVASPKVNRALRFAVVTDLHNAPWRDVAEDLAGCDAILVVGDLINRHRTGFANAADFLQNAPTLAPTFYAIGNHEWKFREGAAYWPVVEKSRVTVLDNRFVDFRGLTLGGFSSAKKPNPDFLRGMADRPGFKLLMCHQPEMYKSYVAPLAIDLTVAGHAHGGQIQLLGRGLYAPGQGFFPRLTHGFYDGGRLLVSRGMTNSADAPRWHNPCELILLDLVPEVR